MKIIENLIWNLFDRAAELEEELPPRVWTLLELVCLLLALPFLVFGAAVGLIARCWDVVAFMWDKVMKP